MAVRRGVGLALLGAADQFDDRPGLVGPRGADGLDVGFAEVPADERHDVERLPPAVEDSPAGQPRPGGAAVGERHVVPEHRAAALPGVLAGDVGVGQRPILK